MLIEPLPGVGLDRLRQTLIEIHTRVANAWTGSSVDVFNGYISWVNDAVRHLSTMISSESLNALVLSQRYLTLQAQSASAALQPVLQLVQVEREERERALKEAIDAVDAERTRWAHPGALVLPDTSFYVNHPEKLEDADIAGVLALRDEPVRLLVPIIVIDELDALKRSGNKDVRWRSAMTLAILERLLTTSSTRAVVRAPDFGPLESGGIPRGEVTVEVLFDPPGHSRLPIADDEIVSRALAAQTRAGRAVRVVTYDTGQAMRAPHAGLLATKLRSDP